MPDDRNAGVRIRPETSASATSGRIPCGELRQSDAVGRNNSSAILALFHQIKLIAVADHARLRRLRSRDAIAGLRW